MDITLFDDIDSEISDLLQSTPQTFERPLKRLSGLLHSPTLEEIIKSLTADVDFDAFLSASEASGGSFLGSHQLAWPPEREKELGLTLILIDRLAADPGWTIHFCHTFYYSGSKIIAGVHTLARQRLIPFARDFRKHLESQLTHDRAPGRTRSVADTRRRIFVSHIHEEAALAKVICDWSKDAFKGSGVTAFASSDRQSLPPGRKWLDVVKENLEGSKVAIAVLSPTSLIRPWPNIELGAAWIQDIAVIPFCHSGIHAGTLPPPFGTFHGVNIDNEDPGRDLFGGIADALRLEHPENLDFARFKGEIMAAAESIKHKPATPSAQPDVGLPEPQVRILQYIATRLNAGEEEVHMNELAIGASVKPASLKGHTQALHDRRLAYISHYANGDTTLRLMPAGSVWLEAHGLMP